MRPVPPPLRLARRTLLAGLGASIGIGIARPATGSPAPASAQWRDLEFIDARDQAFRLDETGARLTLLHLWASWCPVCRDELPALNAAQPVLRRRGIDMLLVSSPRDWAADLDMAASRALGVRAARPSARNAAAAVRSALFDPDGWYYVPRSLLYDHATRRVVWSRLGRLDWRAAPWTGAGA